MNNGRRYSKKVKEKVRLLRKDGWTHREIAKKLGIARSSIFLWTKGIKLSIEQKKEISIKKGIKLIEIYPNDLFAEDSRIFLRKIAKNIS